jgi:hypothetical protein
MTEKAWAWRTILALLRRSPEQAPLGNVHLTTNPKWITKGTKLVKDPSQSDSLTSLRAFDSPILSLIVVEPFPAQPRITTGSLGNLGTWEPLFLLPFLTLPRHKEYINRLFPVSWFTDALSV